MNAQDVANTIWGLATLGWQNLKFERERCCSNWRVLPLLWGFW
jgi:hypothetical protein